MGPLPTSPAKVWHPLDEVATPTLTVLLAEDSVHVRRQLVELLGEIPGLRVVGEASTGREALVSLERLDPQVLILDLRMPGGSGLEVLDTLRRGGRSPFVFVLTNSADPRTREWCMQRGARNVFDKSTEFGELLTALADLASRPEEA